MLQRGQHGACRMEVAGHPGLHWTSDLGHWTLAMVAAAIAGCAGGPIYPIVSSPVATTFRAPYEAVWSAALEAIGVVQPQLVDRTQGRIVTEPFSFNLPVHAGGGGRGSGSVATQVLWVSLDIRVLPAEGGAIAVHAQTTIHRALEYGFWPQPGGPNSPEGDLFARIAARLRQG